MNGRRSSRLAIFTSTVWIFFSVLLVRGDYSIEIRIHNFSNPTSLLANGECCDHDMTTGDGGSCAINGCDSYFHFCLRELGSVGGGCSGGRVSLVNYNAQPINFSLPNFLGLPNPLPLPGLTPEWNGIQLFLQVLEYSGSQSPINLVKEVTHDITADSPLSEESDPVVFTNGNESNQASVVVSFRTVCAENYYGSDCSKYCHNTSSDICSGSGLCIPGVSNYSCICNPGFTGEHCEVDIDECERTEFPCNSRGECVDGIDDFSCICNPGYTGERCEVDIDECELTESPCNDRGECIDGINDFSCICDRGFTGKNCSDIDDCVGVTCSGNGQCVDGMNNYTCFCNPGFTGEKCDIDIDECETMNITCGGNGKCEDGVYNFTCLCDPGYTGRECEHNINDCPQASCSGNGNCVDGINSYTCVCNPGFTGERCELNVNECEMMNVVCSGRGECVDGINDFTCICNPGYTGRECEMNIDDCAYVNCTGHGTCLDGVNNHSCVCDPGYTGANCETDINECVEMSINCSRRGQCTDSLNGYTCVCDPGFMGEDCQVDINECETKNVTCSWHGRCVDDVNSYYCVCDVNFTGTTCNIAVVAEGTKEKGQDRFQIRLISGVFIGIVGFGLITVLVLGSMIAVIGHLKISLKKAKRKKAKATDSSEENGLCNGSNTTSPNSASQNVYSSLQPSNPLGTSIDDDLWHKFDNPLYRDRSVVNVTQSQELGHTQSQELGHTQSQELGHTQSQELGHTQSQELVQQSVPSEPIFDDAIYNTVILLPENARSSSSMVLSQSDRTDSLEHEFQNPIYGNRNESLDTVQRRLNGIISDLRYMSMDS